MIDYRAEFEGLVRRQLEDPALNPQEREVLEASLIIHNAEPFGPVASDSSPEPDFSFLDRYPQDAKLVAMRILHDLGVLDRLGATRPTVHAALVARLMAYEGPRASTVAVIGHDTKDRDLYRAMGYGQSRTGPEGHIFAHGFHGFEPCLCCDPPWKPVIVVPPETRP